jgi:hypothetical protein
VAKLGEHPRLCITQRDRMPADVPAPRHAEIFARAPKHDRRVDVAIDPPKG